MTQGGQKVAVVGAGIVGASIAWHLARGGADVTVFEAGESGGVATPNSFGWINSNYSFERQYFELRHRSMAEWRRLAEALPELPVSLNGALYLPAQDLDLETFAARHSEWGYNIALIDEERARRIEPALASGTGPVAHAQDEGAAEAAETARMLTAAAVDAGATVRNNTAVEALEVSDGRVAGVRTSEETLAADEVVVAAGVETATLVALAGFPLRLTMPPGLLAHTNPAPPLLNGVILADGVHVRQKRDGALVVGADFQGSELSDDPEGGGEELMRRLAGVISMDTPPSVSHTTLGRRPMPKDGLPIVGRIPGVDGVYAAVMHSGVTLAPAIGRFVAEEILEGRRDPLLAPYGPERFDASPPLAAAGE